MKPHDLGVYEDGWTKIAYCKVCSAEGLALAEDCPQKIIIPDPNWDLTGFKKRVDKRH